MTATTNFRYVTLADEIQDNIMAGRFSPGERLPSLRKLHNQLGLSVSTIHQAYIELEKRGRVEAREKSGFYVRALAANPLSRPPRETDSAPPARVRINALADTILADLQSDRMLQLGAALPSKELMPLRQLSRILKSTPPDQVAQTFGNYDPCAGNAQLQKAVAKRVLGHKMRVTPEDVVTTSGCLDAVSLCLRAVASPGDTILVESPVFHCFLQLIEDLNMYVLEVPGCPETGLDPKAFTEAVDANPVKACILNPNFQNPLGSTLSPENKARIMAAANERDLPIIEDDINGDLYYGTTRPITFKSLDTKGLVLYCASVSKTLAPGLRTGWALPGRFRDQVIRIKLNTQLSSPGINHRVVADFLNSGAYDRHLRRLRTQLKNQASAMAIALANHFPGDTLITFPQGGLVIWIVLNKKINTMDIYQKAHEKYISILPGLICSSSNRYQHCMRLNCGIKWSQKLEQGIALLGKLVKKAYREKGLLEK